jgi:DNA-binding NarL/FixJ family response regulator
VREAIAAQFERDPGFEVVGQTASLAEARARLTEPIDVAVVDPLSGSGGGTASQSRHGARITRAVRRAERILG